MVATNQPVLVRRDEAGPRPSSWDAVGRRVIEHHGGFLRILGGPGTGKTRLLADVAADRIVGRGVPPENVLVLTATRPAANRMRDALSRRLAPGSGAALRTAEEPLVRTVHSYAHAVLRKQAVLAGLPPPSFLNEPERDALLRELLAGDLEDGAADWPPALRSALPVSGFADEVRDLLLCAAERGLGPRDLIELGRQYDCPEWAAVGRFGLQYEQVTLLRGGTTPQQHAPAMDAAELVAAALRAFDTDRDLLRVERERVRYLLVDDAQQLDPQQYWLIQRVGATATEFLLAGDPDQAVFAFRGADARGLRAADPDGNRTEVLTVDHRMSQSVRTAVQRIASRLPGSGQQRESVGARDESGTVSVHVLASQAQEAAWVADRLRRAHLLENVPWSRMAIVSRSTGSSLPVLRRALLAAGVPLRLPVDDIPLAQRGAVRPLLTLLRCAARPEELDPDAAAELLASPFGGADPLALRRLRRGLRRLELAVGGDRPSGELLDDVLRYEDQLTALEDATAEPARRVAALFRAAREATAQGRSIEETLWRVWKASGLEQRWLAQVGRGGSTAAQADRDLDAMVAVFEAAAKYADRWPGADPAGFAEYLSGQRIAGNSLAPSAPSDDAVAILTAHSAAGQEWDVVAIPGVQEGVWPDLRPHGSLLGIDRLIDVLSGVDRPDQVSATAPRLAEERRLLLLAASRARRSLVVSAVRGEDEQPSRFLDELEGVAGDPEAAQRPALRPPRGLALADLVGELRQVVCDPEAEQQRRRRAATQLARLARAGVAGAHPDSWYGLPDCSSTEPLVAEDEAVRVSPSTVDILRKCPLRWMIERNGGQDSAELASVTGTLVHALVQAAAEGASSDELRKVLDESWQSVDAGAPWFSRKERERVASMLDAFLAWLGRSRSDLTQLGVERDLDITVPAQEGGPWLRLRGRVDRLEADAEGRPVVVDVKTAKSPISRADAEEHPQLAVYQLAAALGAFHDGQPQEPGGARLLYVAKAEAKSGAATERGQQRLDSERVQVWLDVLHSTAASSVGPAFVASQNPDCPRCPAKVCCPVHPAGRQVGQ